MKIQELSAPVQGQTFVRPSKMNILIADASGSMYWAMNQLARDTTERVNSLPQGDAVLIGLFSSQGWFKWITASELNKAEDYKLVERVIQQEFHTRGTTCFSEIMGNVPKALEPYLAKYPVVSLTFMSDGHPVVYDTQKEIKDLMSAANLVKNYLTSGAVVAYGDYANRALLSDLAKNLGAEFVSAQSVEEIGGTFARLSGAKAAKKKKVAVPKKGLVFAMEGPAVSALDNTAGEVEVPETSQVLVYDGSLDTKELGSEASVYGAALALVVMGEIDEALKVMSDLGDVAIVNQINNALTNAEMKKAEDLMRAAITDEGQRFTAGKKPGCLPPDDAFDLMDLIEVLQSDDSCLFYPYSDSFVYKRTGRRSVVDPKYPKFQPDKSTGVPLSHVTGHSSELNLSVGLNIRGSIKLPEAVIFEDKTQLNRKDVGLPEEYPTNIFRNYSLISNALPVVTSLPVNCSYETYKKLLDKGVHVDAFMAAPGDPSYVIDLTSVPACNKARGKKATNWTWMAKQAIESLKIGSQLKVYKAKKVELDPEGDADKPAALSDEAASFLEACGVTVKSGVFNPPSTQEEATDVLDVRTFEVKIAKSSSVSMKDFLEMMAGKKKINAVGDLMKVAYDDIIRDMPQAKGAAIEWLKAKITDLTKQKRKIDAELAAAKFAVILGGHWNRHFNEDSVKFTVDGWDVSLVVGTTQKKI